MCATYGLTLGQMRARERTLLQYFQSAKKQLIHYSPKLEASKGEWLPQAIQEYYEGFADRTQERGARSQKPSQSIILLCTGGMYHLSSPNLPLSMDYGAVATRLSLSLLELPRYPQKPSITDYCTYGYCVPYDPAITEASHIVKTISASPLNIVGSADLT